MLIVARRACITSLILKSDVGRRVSIAFLAEEEEVVKGEDGPRLWAARAQQLAVDSP